LRGGPGGRLESGRGGSAFFLWMLAPVLLGAGLRFAAMDLSFPTRPVGDELYYLGTAIHIAQGRGHFYDRGNHAYRPPAFSFLLSRFVDLDAEQPARNTSRLLGRLERLDPSHPDPDLPRFLRPLVRLQVYLGTLLVAVTALLGRALFDARTGLLAGFVAAVDPTFIAFSHYLWSDALFAVLITGALIGIVHVERTRGWWPAAATGAVFGAAALTRQLAIPIAGACALWWWWTARPGARRTALLQGALVLGVAALVILPWTYRNYARFGRFVPVATVGSLALGGGNTLESPDWRQSHGPALSAFNVRYFAIDDEMERSDFGRRWGLDRIREEQPTWIFKKMVRSLPSLLTPDSILFYKIGRGSYAPIPTPILRAIAVVTAVAYLLVLIGGVLGIAGAEGHGRRLLPALLLGLVLLVHVITMANARHRLPWMPLLIAYASFAALHLRTLTRRAVLWRGFPPLLLLLAFVGLSLPEFRPIASGLWAGSDDGFAAGWPAMPRAADPATAHAYRGLALMQAGPSEEARRHLEQALSLGHESGAVHAALGTLAMRRGEAEVAVRHLRAALRHRPDLHGAANNLAWLLATNPSAPVRDPEEAIRLAEATRAAMSAPPATVIDTLAAAYAAAGRFDEAIGTATEAAALARESGDGTLADEIEARLALYRSGTAYVDRAGPAED
jgi:hypothetical protein